MQCPNSPTKLDLGPVYVAGERLNFIRRNLALGPTVYTSPDIFLPTVTRLTKYSEKLPDVLFLLVVVIATLHKLAPTCSISPKIKTSSDLNWKRE